MPRPVVQTVGVARHWPAPPPPDVALPLARLPSLFRRAPAAFRYSTAVVGAQAFGYVKISRTPPLRMTGLH